MVPGGLTGFSHQAAPYDAAVSSSASLHCAGILLLLFLFHFSTTRLLLIEATEVSECLGLSLECHAWLVHSGTGQGSSQARSAPLGLRSTGQVVISD